MSEKFCCPYCQKKLHRPHSRSDVAFWYAVLIVGEVFLIIRECFPKLPYYLFGMLDYDLDAKEPFWSVMPLMGVAVFLLIWKDFPELREYLFGKPNLDPEVQAQIEARVELTRGETFYQAGRFDLAIPCFDKAIQGGMHTSTAYRHRGFAYFKTGDFDEAKDDYAQAIRLDSAEGALHDNERLAWLHYQLGVIFEKKGDRELAEANFRRAKELDPTIVK